MWRKRGTNQGIIDQQSSYVLELVAPVWSYTDFGIRKARNKKAVCAARVLRRSRDLRRGESILRNPPVTSFLEKGYNMGVQKGIDNSGKLFISLRSARHLLSRFR